jgi:DNA-binding XRE family transcriptional regulator
MPKRRRRTPPPPPERRAIAERWRAFRDSTGLTQDEWAKLLGCSRTRVFQLEMAKVAVSADDIAIVLKRFPQLNVTALVTGTLPSDYPSAAFQYFLADLAHAADALGSQDSRILTAWRHDHAQILHLYEALKSRNLKPTDSQARELVTTNLRGLMTRI